MDRASALSENQRDNGRAGGEDEQGGGEHRRSPGAPQRDPRIRSRISR